MTTEQLTGQLGIRLHWQAGKVAAVAIHSSRLRLNSRFFTGKPVASAPKLVGMLFSLCGTAQSVASARACEHALGQPADLMTEQQRDFQVQVETLFEHLLRLSQEWPAALDADPPVAADLQALFKLKRELLQAPNPAVMDDIQHWFEHRLLGLPTQRWLDYCQRGDAKKLSIRGKIGNLMSRLCRYDWERLGHHTVQLLPNLPASWWQQRLMATDAEHFCAEPKVDGQACETSSLTRQWHNPALQVWRERYGSGLMTRLIARVLDMLACWRKLNPPQSPFCKGGSEEVAAQSSVPPFAKGGLGGISLIQTARGLLAHRIVQQDSLIHDYQIVAPTEWNFHPHGSLYHMLHGLTAGNEAELRAKAQTLITALDPCVAYQLEITHA